MSLKSATSFKHVPFFPPGIASHKVISKMNNTRDSTLKRPQTVKEMKNMSRNKRNKVSASSPDFDTRQYGLRRMSNSTPNLKVCHLIEKNVSSVPRHNCDMGLVDYGDFKANRLPPYYSSESLERNRSLFDRSKTRSLDRLSSNNSKTKNLTGFVPDRPFYPPSKYPNVHDKGDYYIQRLVETRDRYKTPESRKIARQMSLNNVGKQSNSKSIGHGSVPNLSGKGRRENHNRSKFERDPFRNFYGDQMAYASEIGPYRRSDKLDLQGSDERSGDMFSSYFYPKPIPNKRISNDRMAQSLILERSVASMIFTGSLDRAKGNDQYRLRNEVTDLDDSPSKSQSAPRRPNSFSQDSLDGLKKKPLQHGDDLMGSSPQNEEQTLNSEQDKSTTMSQLEEDELKTLCSNRSGGNYSTDQLLDRDELDQYNIDQLTRQNLTVKDLSSFTYSGRNSPISIGNEFITNKEHSIIGKDDQTLLYDLASKCIVSTSQCSGRIINNDNVVIRQHGADNSDFLSSGYDGLTSDHTLVDDETFHRVICDDHHYDQTFVTSDTGSRIDSHRDDHHRVTRINPTTDQFCERMLVTEDNLSFVSQIHGSDINKSHTLPPDVSGNRGYKYDGVLARDAEILMRKEGEEDRGYASNFFTSLNVNVNDFNDYRNDRKNNDGSGERNVGIRNFIPNIQVEGDMDASDSSSTNEMSWSGYDEHKSFRDFADNSMPLQRTEAPWASSPELHSARYSFTRKPDRHLQSENPLKPLCSYCNKPAYFMERISISNIIFHKSCFRCRKCDTHLNFNNCILYRHRPYCLVHVRPKIWKSVRPASANKLNQIKERLDSKSSIQRQGSTEIKQPKRIFYEGMKSAKTKFLEDATKTKEVQLKNPKRITPPRQGFNAGIVESEPKPRDPNVVSCTDNQTSYYDEMAILTQSSSTKETRDRFREMQNKSTNSKDYLNGDSDVKRQDVIPVDTKSLRNRFLEAANDSDTKLIKINPSDDIQRIAQQQTNSIYENEPESRTDVIRSNSMAEDNNTSPITRNRAKEMKEKFSSFGQDDKPRKSEFKLEYGEGGVYESNPQENNDDVVKHNYDTTVTLPENTVKSGLQRIKDLQDIKSQGYQKPNKEPFKLEVDASLSGVYENTPEQSRADSLSYQNEKSILEFRERNYTNEAKRAFLEKQKLEEEASTNKSTPRMIDIWKDLCPDSGIFENEPKEQKEGVVKYEYRLDELTVQTDNVAINGNGDPREVETSEQNGDQ